MGGLSTDTGMWRQAANSSGNRPVGRPTPAVDSLRYIIGVTIRSNDKMTRVFVTGLGAVSSLGFGRNEYWRNVVAGQSGFSTIAGFDTKGLDRTVAGEVRGFSARDFLTAAE